MQSFKIVALAVGAGVAYGILQDQVTARVCVEYFTIGHPRIVATESPTVLGLVWGVVATWWVGLILGIPLALCARLGGRPKLSAAQLRRPILVLLAVMAVLALTAGITGYIAAKRGAVRLLEPLASRVPREKHAVFLADLWTHLTAYGAGFLGGLGLCGWICWKRRSPSNARSFTHP